MSVTAKNDLVKEILDGIIDQLCDDGLVDEKLCTQGTTVPANTSTEALSCSIATSSKSIENQTPESSSESENENKEDSDSRRWRGGRHFGQGVGAFLKGFRPEKQFAKKSYDGDCSKDIAISSNEIKETQKKLMKRYREDTVSEETPSTSSPLPTTEENTNVQEIPKKLARLLSVTNIKEIIRERKIFETGFDQFVLTVNGFRNNYIKCCKWSLSSKYLSTSSQDRNVRIFQFDPDHTKLELKRTVGLGDLIYDICWHPKNDWLATSSKDHPIHIWDTFGQRQATFRGLNAVYELASAYSLCFSNDGTELYGGYKNVIRKFDMNRPGLHVFQIETWSKYTYGLKGIVSCISMNPVYPGYFAVGSYGRTIGIYSNHAPGAESLFEFGTTAITSIRYTSDGNFLLSAGRKDDDIIRWDLRCPGKVYSIYRRPSTTNQRIYFDIDSSGSYLFSGSSTGDLYIFDLKCTNGDDPVEPSIRINAHRSALCGLSLQQEGTVLATSSGQRIFPMPNLRSAGSVSSETDDEQENLSFGCCDNSLALWSLQ